MIQYAIAKRSQLAIQFEIKRAAQVAPVPQQPKELRNVQRAAKDKSLVRDKPVDEILLADPNALQGPSPDESDVANAALWENVALA